MLEKKNCIYILKTNNKINKERQKEPKTKAKKQKKHSLSMWN